MSDVMLAYISAITSVEYNRFLRYLQSHPTRHNKDQSRLLPAYALGEWARGLIDPSVYEGLEAGAKDRMAEWAMSMAELNTVFLEKKVSNPEKFVIEKALVVRDPTGIGWEPDLEKIMEVLKVDVRMHAPA